MECYICTDITDEKSPCECQAPVHMKCLEQWIKKLDNKRLVCSICNREFRGINMEKVEIDLTDVEIDVPDSTVFKPCKFLCYTAYLTSLGYIGKIVFALFNDPIVLTYPWYWFPFDFIFVTSVFFMVLFITFLKPLVSSICEYISHYNSSNYEQFVDFDSDSGHNEESIV